ncbi:MAG: hypothetical protein JXA15_05600 [Spirochaetales bacterium]|nr:hypothetical protein [Spirochaetales bacterium]
MLKEHGSGSTWVQLLLAALLLGGCKAPDAGLTEPIPAWASESIAYRLVIDRFANGDASNDSPIHDVDPAANFLGGDLQGLQAKIESGFFTDLGVNLLIISSPVSGPDTGGMRSDGHQGANIEGGWPVETAEVDGRYGSPGDLASVIEAAHLRGIRVVLEYEARHVHESAPVFNAHPDWFTPAKILGDEIPWDGDEAERGWIAPYLPAFDFSKVSPLAWSVEAAVDWVAATDADGVLLLDTKVLSSDWINAFHERFPRPSDRDILVLGDFFSGSYTDLLSKIDPDGGGLDGVIDYSARASIVSGILTGDSELSIVADSLESAAGMSGGVLLNTVSGPQFGRGIHFAETPPLWPSAWDSGGLNAWSSLPAISDEEAAYERLGLAYALAFAMPGIPVVFYGDEIGLHGGGNPDNLKSMPSDVPDAPAAKLRELVVDMANLRSSHPALREGSIEVLLAEGDALSLRLWTSDETLFLVLNRGDGSEEAGGLPAGSLIDLLGSGSYTGPTLTIPPRTVRILYLAD